MNRKHGDVKGFRHWLTLGVALMPMMMTAPAFAADDAEKLEDVVVSANRTEMSVKQTGSAISVITAEDIEESQATNARDVLQNVPGINFYSNGGRGKASSIFIRGMGAKHVLVLIDGVEVGDTSSSQTTYNLTNLMVDNIERVEVLKGNQSTLYGSDAIGGVISITTKSGKGSGKLYTGSAGTEIGSFTTRKAYVNARGEYGKVYYSGAVTGYGTEGWDISAKGDSNDSEEDGYNNTSADLKLGSDVLKDFGVLDVLNVETSARWMKGLVETDASASADSNEETRKEEIGLNLALNADMFDGILENRLAVSYANSQRDMFSDGQRKSIRTFYNGSKTKYEYEGVFKPIEDNTFVYGVEQEREFMDTDTRSAKNTMNTGYYANYILSLLDDDLTLTAGVRNDETDKYGGETTYRGTMSYMLNATNSRFHTSYGTGFRAPSLYELYSSYGNADLKPERSKSFDFGVEQSLFDDRLVVDVTAFRQVVENEVLYSATAWQYYNGTNRYMGIEASLDAEVTDEVQLTGGYIYNQARDNDSGSVTAVRPHHSGNVRVMYNPNWLPDLSAWTKARFATWNYDPWANKKYVGGYTVFDVGGDYKLTDDVSVYGRVENLLDKDYYTKGEYEEPGLAGYVGVRVKF